MTYNEFEQEIMRMAASATEEARIRFARETITLLRSAAAPALATELSASEQELLSEIVAFAERGSAEGLRPKLKQLTDQLCSDEVRAVEFHPDVTELLCAIDNLIAYSEMRDPRCIGRVAINMVNSIDHAIGGDSNEYSIGNMLAAEPMRREYERQKSLLTTP
jgi:hypothetical protein